MKNFIYAFFCFAVLMTLTLSGSWGREAAMADSRAAEKDYAEPEGKPEEKGSPAPGTVEITPTRQQLIGLRLGVVEKKPEVHTFRILGRIAADETKIYRINASVDGWIQEAPYNTVGSFVKKGEVLATFTNPQFIDAEQGYLFSIDTVERLGLHKRLELGRKERPDAAAFDPFVLQRQMDLLRGMGMGDAQIEEIGRTRRMMLNIRIVSPADGFITARKVSPGERFLKGTELYRIEDLSRVWILADVYEQEVQFFKAGEKAQVSVPSQRKAYHAAVSKVLPVFDPSTRTLKVRLETDNPGFLLRPDMFVDVEFPISYPAMLSVPEDAVLDSGLKKTVFVYRGEGRFEPREVETDRHIGDRVEIISGLKEGEKIATSGNFLIDSESKMELAASGMHETLSKDPVNGADVSVNKALKAGRKSHYKGKTYYFSSRESKGQFEKEPGRYVKE